jgi:hypothetical protein
MSQVWCCTFKHQSKHDIWVNCGPLKFVKKVAARGINLSDDMQWKVKRMVEKLKKKVQNIHLCCNSWGATVLQYWCKWMDSSYSVPFWQQIWSWFQWKVICLCYWQWRASFEWLLQIYLLVYIESQVHPLCSTWKGCPSSLLPCEYLGEMKHFISMIWMVLRW